MSDKLSVGIGEAEGVIGMSNFSSESLPGFRIDVRLIENTSKGTDRDFVMPRHDDRIGATRRHSRKLYVTPLRADFFKPADSRRRLI